MYTQLKSQRGMSLVEATIILLVLATLTAVLSPSMGDYVEDARQMKVKEDVEAIGISIQRLLRDTGFKALRKDGATAHTLANRVDLLVSDGTTPGVGNGNYVPGAGLILGALNWDSSAVAQTDTVAEQLAINATTPYSVPTTFLTRGKGWRGAYLSMPIGSDPWGFRYAANTVFLSSATNADAGTGEGQLSGGWTKDVVVISAGPDGIVQSPIEGSTGGGSGTTSGDDVIFVVQGNTR